MYQQLLHIIEIKPTETNTSPSLAFIPFDMASILRTQTYFFQASVISACVLLHNFLLRNHDGVRVQPLKKNPKKHKNQKDAPASCVSAESRAKREVIKDYLWHNNY